MYTAKRRDVLGYGSTRTKIFPDVRGMYNPMHPDSRQCTSYDHPLINPSHGMYQEILPYSAMKIGSFKINTSLMMIKEWRVSLLKVFIPGGVTLRASAVLTDAWMDSSITVFTDIFSINIWNIAMLWHWLKVKCSIVDQLFSWCQRRGCSKNILELIRVLSHLLSICF